MPQFQYPCHGVFPVAIPDFFGDESCFRIKTAQKHLTRKLISALARQGGDMGQLGFLFDREVNIDTLKGREDDA